MNQRYTTSHLNDVWCRDFLIKSRHNPCSAQSNGIHGAPGGWLYRFDLPMHTREGNRVMGATHAAEMAFTFNSFANLVLGYRRYGYCRGAANCN